MKKQIFKYPKGLYTIAFVEIWERFSFYGMRYCFILYMVKELMFTHQKSSHIYGVYSALAYFAPLICGYIVDRYIGTRKAITIGSWCRLFGLLLLGCGKEEVLYPSLILIIIATGFLRAGMNPMVGLIYNKDDDISRDLGFRYFYTLAHIGALFGIIICGYLGQHYGYRYAFIFAGFTIMIGQIGYILTANKTLGHLGEKPIMEKESIKTPLTKQEKNNLWAMFIIYFIFINICDICYEQQGNSITMFVEHHINRKVGNFLIPTPWFSTIEAIIVIFFTPILGIMWYNKEKQGKGMSYISKFSFGLLLVSLSFIVLIIATYYVEKQQTISMLWIIATTTIQTIGEIYIFPTGNSLAVKLSPKKFLSLCFGLVSLESCFANFISGIIGGLYSSMDKISFFMIFTILSLLASLILFLIRKKLMKIIN